MNWFDEVGKRQLNQEIELFDPTGYRDMIRQNINRDADQGSLHKIMQRTNTLN